MVSHQAREQHEPGGQRQQMAVLLRWVITCYGDMGAIKKGSGWNSRVGG